MPEIVTELLPVPEIAECVCVPQPNEKVCIEFPLVGEICSTRSTFDYQPFAGVLLPFIGNLQPLLAPLLPLLTIISLVTALVDCIKSVPKAISQLSPGPVLDCIDNLLAILPKLTQFIPPFNYIALMRSIIFFMITLLQAIIDQLNTVLSINVDVDLFPNEDFLCCLDSNVRARTEQFLAAVQPTGPLFQIVAEVLRTLSIPGTEDYIDPIIEGAELLSGASAANVDPGFIAILQTLQTSLEAIHTVLGGVLAEVQIATECECP